MTNKQKKQINNIVQATLKIVGCSILFIGMTMALGINVNPHMELTAYILLFVGTLMIMIHSFRSCLDTVVRVKLNVVSKSYNPKCDEPTQQ